METNQSATTSEVMNADEAAVFLKMPKSTLLKLCADGELPGLKIGRQWRFNRAALEKWASERTGDEALESVGEPVEIEFSEKLAKAETRIKREIKPVVEETVGSVGGFDFETTGDVIELDDEVSEVKEIKPSRASAKAPKKAPAKAPVKAAPAKPAVSPRSSSALDLMAEISEKAHGKKGVRVAKTKPAPVPAKAPSPAVARQNFRETVRETFPEHKVEHEAVEISRPYKRPGASPADEAPEKPEKATGAFDMLKKAVYSVLIVGVIALAGFGVRTMLMPISTDLPTETAPKRSIPTPTLPDFQVVYKHNDPEEAEPKTSTPPVLQQPVIAQPAPIREVPPAPAPTPARVAQEVAAQPVVPISSQQPVDRNLDAINRLLPTLFNLPGCKINSNNSEIRITFHEGIFSTGVNIESNARAQLSRVSEFLAKNAPDFWLIIEGQTDGSVLRAKSPFKDNYTLGLRRALAATEVMRGDGKFPADRLLASSAGGNNPPYPVNDPGSTSKNKTVVLRLIPKVGGPSAAPR